MLDVSEIITDPDFAQTFTVTRSSGHFGAGGWIEDAPQALTMQGTVTPTTSKDLMQVAEGDRALGLMNFHTTQQLFITHNAGTPGSSDRITWDGDDYKLLKIFPYSDYGYYKAIGARVTGD